MIASHYGLELCGDLQREIPPFRSVYQTSEYFATIRAIQETRCGSRTMKAGAIEMRVQTDGRKISLEPIPVVFEVGRTGPFALEFMGADDTRPRSSRPHTRKTSSGHSGHSLRPIKSRCGGFARGSLSGWCFRRSFICGTAFRFPGMDLGTRCSDGPRGSSLSGPSPSLQ